MHGTRLRQDGAAVARFESLVVEPEMSPRRKTGIDDINNTNNTNNPACQRMDRRPEPRSCEIY